MCVCVHTKLVCIFSSFFFLFGPLTEILYRVAVSPSLDLEIYVQMLIAHTYSYEHLTIQNTQILSYTFMCVQFSNNQALNECAWISLTHSHTDTQ